MSKRPTIDPERAAAYVTRLLDLSPITEGHVILRARAELLGLPDTPFTAQTVVAAPPQPDRRQLMAELAQVRGEFWSLSPEDLDHRLAALAGQGYAELDAAVARLQVVAKHRAQILPLVERSNHTGPVGARLRSVFVLSSRDTLALREQVVASFRNRRERKSGRRLLAALKAELPAIYALEADWFGALSREKPPLPRFWLKSNRMSQSSLAANGEKLRNYWWVVFILVGLLRVFMQTTNDSNSVTRPYQSPEYRLQIQPESGPQRPVPFTQSPEPDHSNYDWQKYDAELKKIRESAKRPPSGVESGVWEPYPAQSNPTPSRQFDSTRGIEMQGPNPSLFPLAEPSTPADG